MKRFKQIVLIILLLSSCLNRELDHGMSTLKENVVRKGDIDSYEKLSSYYFEKHIDSLFIYSKVMADKYKYPRAFYDVFEIIYILNSKECVDYDLTCLDDETREIALTYLINSIELGDKTASSILLDYYDKTMAYTIEQLYKNSILIDIAKSNLCSKSP